jgi:hypothetical protein
MWSNICEKCRAYLKLTRIIAVSWLAIIVRQTAYTQNDIQLQKIF